MHRGAYKLFVVGACGPILALAVTVPERGVDQGPSAARPASAASAAAGDGPQVVALFPVGGAREVNPDAQLVVTSDQPVELGSGIFECRDAVDDSLVARIEASVGVAVKEVGGLPNFHYYPVLTEGNRAIISLPPACLHYGHDYFITWSKGALESNHRPLAASGDKARWRFRTRAIAPKPARGRLVVAADGSGDYSTVQGALDAIEEGNREAITIYIRRGLYREIIFFTNKHNVTLMGEDRDETVIAYPNNARLNADSGGNPFAPNAPSPSEASAKRGGSIYRRGLFLAHHVDDLTLTHLTLRNTTPPGGTQAEAVILNGTTSARAILKDVNLFSYQDTLQINGQAYLEGCRIEGDVDFMWGTGPCYFEDCQLRSLRSGAYYTQIRNPKSNHGFIYNRCLFTGLPGVMGNYLSRIAPSRFPGSEVVLLNCTLGPAVGPVAWQLQGNPGATKPGIENVHFWEYNNLGAGAAPIETRFRLEGSRQLDRVKDAALITNYQDYKYVLGGWNPREAKIFQGSPPLSPGGPGQRGAPAATETIPTQMAMFGTSALLEVPALAQGGLADRYRWRRNGAVIPHAFGRDLLMPAVAWADAGVYSAQREGDTAVESETVCRLTVVAPQSPSPPVLPNLSAKLFSVLDRGAVGDGVTDNAPAIQRTIDAAAAGGGGRVHIPAAPRPYLSGPLLLANGVELYISRGAILQALPYAAPAGGATKAYPTGSVRYPDFISGTGLHDLALAGEGAIDGDGEAWWRASTANPGMAHRPYLIRLNQCDRVLVSGLTFTRSPMFHLALSGVDNLTVFGVTINTPAGPNTDGIDPSGSHQLLQNCTIATGDDNIVMKPGGVHCSDITIADCLFGVGHGMSVGGQTNQGLERMTVKNCYFEGTTAGLRLKADATQGGPVQNITYSGLDMHHVQYPIVFYSYYNKVGAPGATSGKNETTIQRVNEWNASPPNSLKSATLPSWREISVTNLWASGTTGFSTIWGLDLPGYRVEKVRLENVHLIDGPGMEIYNTSDIQFTGDSQVPALRVANSSALGRPKPAGDLSAPLIK